MPTERLWVVRDGEVLADLDRDDDRRLSLRFRPEIVTRGERAAPLISVSLPARAQPYEESSLLPFFEGLLPEGAIRDQLVRRFRLDPSDTFGLLREIGRDCAGALSLVPEGEDLSALGQGDVRWLDEEGLAREVADLGTRPLADEPEEGVRISLAGAQSKMAVVIREGRTGLPLGTTPSTHIIKPASIELRGARDRRPKYPSLVANEAFCTVLARRAGLNAVSVLVMTIGDAPALVVERYDRTTSAGRVARVHQEDLGQALGVRPIFKYEADGGPGLVDCLTLVTRTSVDVLADQQELLDRIAFNYLIGNEDAHMKNLSLLHATSGTRLSPAYDLLSTFVYPDIKKGMAMAINGMYDSRALRPVHWRKAFRQLDLPEQLYAGRFADLAERVAASVAAARADVQAWHLGNGTLDQLVGLVLDRAAELQKLRTL